MPSSCTTTESAKEFFSLDLVFMPEKVILAATYTDVPLVLTFDVAGDLSLHGLDETAIILCRHAGPDQSPY